MLKWNMENSVPFNLTISEYQIVANGSLLGMSKLKAIYEYLNPNVNCNICYFNQRYYVVDTENNEVHHIFSDFFNFVDSLIYQLNAKKLYFDVKYKNSFFTRIMALEQVIFTYIKNSKEHQFICHVDKRATELYAEHTKVHRCC